jgi:hypothetical protein
MTISPLLKGMWLIPGIMLLAALGLAGAGLF